MKALYADPWTRFAGELAHVFDEPAKAQFVIAEGPTCQVRIHKDAHQSIKCKQCSVITHSETEVRERYCPRCKLYHQGTITIPGVT